LKSHGDERGFFREIFRETEPLFSGGYFAQWSHSFMQKDVVKAWHYHHLQHDWWYVPIGQIATCLIDFRQESPTYRRKLLFKMGEHSIYDEDTCELCVCIPPGVLHGCRVLSDSAHLFYITSKVYNPEYEGRYHYNDPDVPNNWGDGAIVVENDRRHFVPSSPRIKLFKQP
ncbi:MAG: hypothetical protein GYA55_06420, partial [SAR324 cluster bacterium]|nr:hypothetical protein [SAR324 cluster bacterium]